MIRVFALVSILLVMIGSAVAQSVELKPESSQTITQPSGSSLTVDGAVNLDGPVHVSLPASAPHLDVEAPSNDVEIAAYGGSVPAGEGPSFVCQNTATLGDRTCSFVARYGSSASPSVIGALKFGWWDGNVWHGDVDFNLDPGSGLRSRLRIGSSGTLIVNPFGTDSTLDPSTAQAYGYLFLVNKRPDDPGASNVFAVTNNGITINNGSGADLLTASVSGVRKFRVDGYGRGYFANGTQTGGADFAEAVEVEQSGSYSPGDVLVITNGDRKFTVSSSPYSTKVAGIYSTKPGVLATPRSETGSITSNEVPLAITGIVPCKVTNENGAIAPGDLLVTSSRPGYAMKGTDASRLSGAILGKALGSSSSPQGVVEVLVTLR